MYKKIVLFVFILISLNVSFSQGSKVVSDFENNKAFSNAIIGFCIQDVNGKEVLSLNKDVSLTPASILKIITTATALEILGPKYRFPTEFLSDSEHHNKLLIRGYGDPTLGSEHFGYLTKKFLNQWVEEIKKKFSNSLSEIEIDDSYFGYNGVSLKWIREDMGNYYAAGSYGISIFDNSYKLFFNTTKNSPEIIKTDPEMSDILFTNTLKLNTSGKDNGYIMGEPFSNKRFLIGDIPSGKISFSIKGDIPDPGLYLGNLLAKQYGDHSIIVTTTRSKYFNSQLSKNRTSEPSQKIFFTYFSPPLKDIIRVVNVKSNNHYAEHLIRAVGRSKDNITTYYDPLEEGVNAINTHWQAKGLDTSALFMYDGCGLSPSNAISPQLMCNVLSYMYSKSKNSESFLASFPKAGKEGTVRNFLRDSALSGKVFVKSGSIANVQCYAGYYISGEKEYVFTIMVNNFKKNSRRETIKAIENLLITIF